LLLFLSYAYEDREVAREIAERLGQEHIRIYPPQNGDVSHQIMISGIEGAIGQADGFLVLLSPHSLASSSCQRERDLALHQERSRRTNGSEPAFIQVLKIGETPSPEIRSLQGRPWHDLTSKHSKEIALSDLADSFTPRDDGTIAAAGAANDDTGLPIFRNREEELDAVRNGLVSESGEHFWLVIAPPQLGKTWFLERISQEITERQPDRWIVHPVDVRKQAEEVRGNPEELLRVMFGCSYSPVMAPNNVRQQAIDIKGTDKFHLYLLDSAELLDTTTVRQLRWYLSQVNHYIQERRNKNVRLALIVASRRDRDWRGVSPRPRLKTLPLSKFEFIVVQDALEDLARDMNREISPGDLRKDAELVYRMSEGLPALLYQYLNWIQEQQWTDLQRLEDREQFDKLTGPYIEGELLSQNSLFRSGPIPTSEKRVALEQALKVLVLFRFLTQSHLRHYVDSEGTLRRVFEPLRWTVEEFWEIVSNTDLLSRPAREPWEEIYEPIRRLLCRHWYPSERELAKAHHHAGDFIQSWLSGQLGIEQAVIMVECLWHQSQILTLSRSVNMDRTLIRLARDLSASFVPSSIHSQEDLRQYAVDRMREDAELAEAVDSVDGLFGRLIDAVLRPAED